MMNSGNYQHPWDIFPGKTTVLLRKENSTEYLRLDRAVQSGKLSVDISHNMKFVVYTAIIGFSMLGMWLTTILIRVRQLTHLEDEIH